MKKTKISDATLVLFLTAYSYFVSYLYFAGKYRYFNLPIYLIEVTLENIIFSIFSIASFILAIYIILNLFTKMIPNDLDIRIVELIKKHIVINLYYITIIILSSPFSNIKIDVKSFLLVGIGMFMVVALDFIIPLFTQKNIKGYQNKLIAEIEKNKKNYTVDEYKHSLNNLVSKHAPLIPTLIILMFLSALLSYSLGIYYAYNQEDFTVIDDRMVVLGIYEKNFIVKTIDLKENSLSENFSIISNKDSYNFTKKQMKSLTIK